MLLNSLFILILLSSNLCQLIYARTDNLCPIQILFKNKGHIVSITNRTTARTIKIFEDTRYEVFCSTYEKVRRKSLLTITRIKNNVSTILSDQTIFSTDFTNSYVNGIVKINNITNYKEYFNLYCRFLPVDPKIYCETKLRLVVVPSIKNQFEHIILILIILFSIVTVGFALKLCLKYQYRLSNDSKSNSRTTYVSFNNPDSKDVYQNSTTTTTTTTTSTKWDTITRF